MDEDSIKDFSQLFAMAFDPELVRCGTAVRSIADYDIPQAKQAPFLGFHNFITDPQPSYVTAWRSDERLERKWYHAHVNGVLGDLRGALAAAHYHQNNLAALEDAVTQVLTGSQFAERMGNATMALGGTRKLDFEYQAFVLACRRALDYLAGALASYFKFEANSFRSLPKSIAKRTPVQVVDAITQAHARHVDDLAFILAEGRQSTRNRIAHYEFVAAGVINLSRRGFVLVGGGEDLALSRGAGDVRLQDALTTRLDRLHSCTEDMLDIFVRAARAAESQG